MDFFGCGRWGWRDWNGSASPVVGDGFGIERKKARRWLALSSVTAFNGLALTPCAGPLHRCQRQQAFYAGLSPSCDERGGTERRGNWAGASRLARWVLCAAICIRVAAVTDELDANYLARTAPEDGACGGIVARCDGSRKLSSWYPGPVVGLLVAASLFRRARTTVARCRGRSPRPPIPA